MRTDIKHECSGRWDGVLKAIGVNERIFNGKHGECIYCGGKDRARWVKNEQFYICNQCGSHSAMNMAIDHLGLSFNETAQELRQILGTTKMTAPVQTDDSAKVKARIDSIVSGLQKITSKDAAGLYLIKRGIKAPPAKGLAFHPGLPYYADGVKQGIHPAMVGIIRNAENKVIGLQINYLTADGKKLAVDDNKKNIGDKKGGMIRLGDVTNGALAVAEGVGTALAFHQKNSITTWAAIDAVNMASITIPDDVHTVYVVADNDKSYTGQYRAFELANRLTVKDQKKVYVVQLVNVMGGNLEACEFPTGLDYLDFIATIKE